MRCGSATESSASGPRRPRQTGVLKWTHFRAMYRVMARLNLTLDGETFGTLRREARKEKTRVATYARRLLREAISRREQQERRRRWAEAYRADRADAAALARDLEPGELELMGDEDG